MGTEILWFRVREKEGLAQKVFLGSGLVKEGIRLAHAAVLGRLELLQGGGLC